MGGGLDEKGESVRHARFASPNGLVLFPTFQVNNE
jgi:hypothetical protein